MDLPFVSAPATMGHRRRYTNRELWGLLNPANGHLPYIYDEFTRLGVTGEMTAAARCGGRPRSRLAVQHAAFRLDLSGANP